MRSINTSAVPVALSSVALFSEAGGRARRILTAVALAVGLCGGAIAIDTPIASAAPNAGPLCSGYSACSAAPYTTHNYQYEMNTLYWPGTGSSGVECTNYVAWVESSVYGVATPTYALGHATNWASAAEAHGVTVNQTPTVGSVAQWNAMDHDIGSDGHVAIVEAVGPNDSYIVISQDNWSSDTNDYGWALILADTPNQGEPWPDKFIHFSGTGLPTTLSDTQPDRLIQSTGNLYWTADQTLDGMSQADVFRASKDNQPGQEQILYQESRPTSTPVDFEAITYANVGGNWYGYFVANYPGQNESQIMRVPLTGGAAVVLATSPAVIGNGDLVTDGSFLYWADADGIRKMAIAGGTVQTLVPGQTYAHLGLDGQVLYFTSGNDILSIPTSGAPTGVLLLVAAEDRITAMYPPSAINGNVYWAEADGSVSYFPVAGPDEWVHQLQAASPGDSVTSVSVADNYILWGGCVAKEYGGTSTLDCTVDGYDNGHVVSVPTSGPSVDVQGDAGAWYWGDSDLEKFTL
jgi:surface antigen